MLARNQSVRTLRQFEELVRVMRARFGGGASARSSGGDGSSSADGDLPANGRSTGSDDDSTNGQGVLLTLRQIKYLMDESEDLTPALHGRGVS